MGEENVNAVYNGYVAWKGMCDALTEMVKELCLIVKGKAREDGKTVKAVEHKYWYPYWSEYIKRTQKWKNIRQNQLEDFLGRYLTGEQILGLISLSERRANALVLWSYMHRLLVDLGVVVEED